MPEAINLIINRLEPAGLLEHWKQVFQKVRRRIGQVSSMEANFTGEADVYTFKRGKYLTWNITTYLLKILQTGSAASAGGFVFEILVHKISTFIFVTKVRRFNERFLL
jgi:hypothetical protein